MPESAHAERSDAELLDIVRAGDTSAFAVLWQRHSRAGLAAARHFGTSSSAEDIVSEAYLRILELILDGRGPHGAFRPYMYRTVRTIAADVWRRPEDTSDELERIPEFAEAGPWEDHAFDRNAAARAFESLNERWQAVLWYTEVEGMPPRDVARILGLSANGVSALAKRAREALQSAWVEAHIDRELRDAACGTTLDHLQRYQRGKLTAAASRAVSAHLDTCESCAGVAAEYSVLNRQLALVLVGVLLGGGPTLGFLSGVGGTAPATAAGLAADSARGPAGSIPHGATGGASPVTPAGGGSGSGAGAAGTATGGILSGLSGTLLIAAATAAAIVISGGALFLSQSDAPSTPALASEPTGEADGAGSDGDVEDGSEPGTGDGADRSSSESAEGDAGAMLEDRSNDEGAADTEANGSPVVEATPAGTDAPPSQGPDADATPGIDMGPGAEPQPSPGPNPRPDPAPEPQPEPGPDPDPDPDPDPVPQETGDPSLTPFEPRWARCGDGRVYIEGRSALHGALVFARVIDHGQTNEHPEQMQVLGDARWYTSTPIPLRAPSVGDPTAAIIEIQLRLADGRASPWTLFPLEASNELSDAPAYCATQ